MAETKKCPYCAEEILLDAIKCKHCHSKLGKEKGEFDIAKWVLDLFRQSPEIIFFILLIIGWFLPWGTYGKGVMNGKILLDNIGNNTIGLVLFSAERAFSIITVLSAFVVFFSITNMSSKNRAIDFLKAIFILVSGTIAVRLSLPIFRISSETGLGHLLFFISSILLIVISLNSLKRYKLGLFFPAAMICSLFIPYSKGKNFFLSDYGNLIFGIIIGILIVFLIFLNLMGKFKLYGIVSIILFTLTGFVSLLLVIFDLFSWGDFGLYGSSFNEYNSGLYLFGVLSIGVLFSGIRSLKSVKNK